MRAYFDSILFCEILSHRSAGVVDVAVEVAASSKQHAARLDVSSDCDDDDDGGSDGDCDADVAGPERRSLMF